MSLDLGKAVFTLAGTMAPLGKTLDQADVATKSWAGRMKATIDGIGTSMMGIGAKMTAGVTAPIVAAGIKAIDSASDLKETINKIDVVFGESAAAMKDWGANSAEAFGLSKQAALDSAGTFGNLFTSMEIGKVVAADMSQGLVELAADMASFNNVDISTVLDAFRSGISGEVEPLRRLGINISAATVEAEAMRLGLVKADVDMRKVTVATSKLSLAQGVLAEKTKKYGADSKEAVTARNAVATAEMAVEKAMAGSRVELTAAMKAEASYSLFLQQTANAQGDFARTSEGLANAQRILKAQLADAMAALGESLLPIAEKIVNALSGMVAKFTALSPETKRFIVIGAGIAAAIGPAVTILGALVTGLGALISPVGLVIGIVGALGVAFATNFLGIRDKAGEIVAALAPHWEAFKTGLSELKDAAVTKFGELRGAFESGGLPAVGEKLVTWGQELITALRLAAPGWITAIRLKMGEVWANLTNFGSVTLPALGQQLLAWGQQVVADLAAAAPGWITAIKTKMAEVWAALTNPATGVLPVMSEKVRAWGAQLVLDIQTAAPGWIVSIQTALAGLWDSLTFSGGSAGGGGMLATGPGQGLTWFGEALAKIGTVITGLRPVFEFFAPTVDRIKAAFAGFGEKMQPVIDKLPALGTALASLKPAFDLVAGVVGVVVKLLGEVFVGVINAIPGILGGVITAITGSIAGVGALLGGVIETIKKLFEGDWKGAWEAAKTTVEEVATGIGTAITGILAVADEIFGGVYDAIVNTVNDLLDKNIPKWDEFKEAVKKKFEELVAGVKEKLEEVKTWVKTKLDEAKAVIEGINLFDVGANIIQGLIDGLASKAVALATKIAELAGSLIFGTEKTVQAESPSRVFFRIGENISEGLALGIAAQANLAVNNMTDLTGRAIGAAQAALGIHSPSTVFRDMGLQMMRGMGAGIEMGSIDALDRLLFAMKQMIDALAKFANDQVALNDSQNIRSAKAVTDPIATIVNNVVDILGGLEKLKDFEIPTDVATRMQGAAEAFAHIVDALALFANTQVAKGTSDNIHSAKAVMEAFGPMAEQLIRSLEMLDALAVWEPKVEGFAANAAALGLAVKTMIEKMAQVAQGISEDDLADALGLSFYLGTIATMLKDVPALLQTISNGTAAMAAIASMDAIPKGLGPNIDRLSGFLAALVGNLEKWFASLPADTVQRAADFADTIGPALGAVKTAVEAMKALPAIADIPTGLGPLIDRLSGFLATLVGNLGAWIKDFDSALVERAAEFARNASTVAQMVGGAVSAMTALSAFKDSGDLRAKFDKFFKVWSYIFTEWVKLAREASDWQDERVKKFSDALSSAGEALTKALAFMVDLGAWRMARDLQERVILFVRTLSSILDELAREFVTWDADARDLVGDFSAAVGSLFGGLKAALDVASAIPRTWGNYDAWGDFQTWVMRTFDSLAAWLAANYPESIEDAEAFGPVKRWGEALGAIFGGLRAAMDWAVALPKNWTPPSNLLMFNFVGWVAATFAELENMLRAHFMTSLGIVVITEEGMSLVSAFGNALGSIFGGLRAAMDWAVSLPKSWTPPAGLLTWNILAWVSLTFAELQGMLENARFMTSTGIVVITEAGMRLVNAFGAAVTSVFGGLKAALDFAVGLPATWSVDIGVWAPFLQWVEGVFAELQGFIEARWPSTPDEAQDFGPVAAFGTALTSVFGGLQAALQMAAAVPKTWSAPDAATWDAFFDWTTGVFVAFAERVKEWAAAQTDPTATTGIVGAFAQAFGSVMTGLASALDLFAGLQTFIPLLEDRIDEFLAAVTYTYGRIATYATGEGIAAATEAVTAFAQAASVVFGGLSAALTLYQELAQSTPTTWDVFEVKITALIGRITESIQQFVTAAAGAPVWTAAAEAFDLALNRVVDVLGRALDFFVTLQENGVPSSAQLNAFLQAVLTLFDQVAAGLSDAQAELQQTVKDLLLGLSSGALYDAAWSSGRSLGSAFISGMTAALRAGSAQMAGVAAGAYQPIGGTFATSSATKSERRVIVEFRGEAGGGVPLEPWQFEMLKNELVKSVQLGA